MKNSLAFLLLKWNASIHRSGKGFQPKLKERKKEELGFFAWLVEGMAGCKGEEF